MKILLIHPSDEVVYESFERKQIAHFPIGLGYIAAMGEKAGHDVYVLDYQVTPFGAPELEGRIADLKPQLVGVTCTTPVFKAAGDILKTVKKVLPETKTLLGGPHINALPESSLHQCPDADFAIFGEGEDSFAELLAAIAAGGDDYRGILGVAWRGPDGQVTMNRPRPMAKDIDLFPIPARHLFEIEKYSDPDRYQGSHTIFISSRGCPFRCKFCASQATWGRKVRFRSPEKVVDEAQVVVNDLGIRHITINDDTFTASKRNVLEICRLIEERGLKFSFLCSSRVNTIDEEMAAALARAGCCEITFGIESADPEILKNICKDIDISRAVPVFKMVREHGIRVHSSYIVGNPGDTHETINKTIDFAVESGTDYAQFSVCVPFPGTPLWREAVEKGMLKTDDYTKFTRYYSVVANFSQVSDEELVEYQREGYRRFNAAKRDGRRDY